MTRAERRARRRAVLRWVRQQQRRCGKPVARWAWGIPGLLQERYAAADWGFGELRGRVVFWPPDAP